MVSVIKRNNRRQKFSQAKLKRSIESAGKEAHLSNDQRKKLAREVAESIQKFIRRKSAIRATELRRRVLQRIETRSKATLKAWQRYDRKKRKHTR